MAIYIDDARIKRSLGHSVKRWSHLVAIPLDENELTEFADRIGLSREWIQRSSFLHFDVSKPMRKKAIAAGAIAITARQLVEKVRAERSRH